jgi:hypothetical protein
MVRHRPDLEAERRHVLEQPMLDDLAGLDLALAAMREPFFHKSRDGSERLQIGWYAQLVQRYGHGWIPPNCPQRRAGCCSLWCSSPNGNGTRREIKPARGGPDGLAQRRYFHNAGTRLLRVVSRRLRFFKTLS